MMNEFRTDQLNSTEYADYLMEMAKSWPEKLVDKDKSHGTTKWKTLHQKLLEIYLEESHKQPANKNVRCTSNLLAQLVKREHLSTIIINLYPGNEGYSLMLRGRNGADAETIRLPYEEHELLDYIDAEKLPPLLVDLLEKAQANLFHSGCVVAEVRDYRRAINNTYNTVYVLLQPTMHTLLCDINAITSDFPGWTSDEKLALESQLLLQTSDPLCLDPSPSVFILASKMNYDKHKLNTPALRRYAKRHSQAAINRKRKISLCSAPKYLKLHDFVTTKKTKYVNNTPVNLKIGKPTVDMWKRPEVQLTTPENIDVMKYAKVIETPELASDNSPVVLEEYSFETERGNSRVNLSRLTIMQRLSDEFYMGALYVDRDYKEGESNGSTCRFNLGSRADVERYIRQFREIFTEEGRRQVKITHQIPGQPPTVTYTQVVQIQPVASSQAASSGPAAEAAQPASVRPVVSGTVNSNTNVLGQGHGATVTATQANVSASDSSARLVAPLRLSLSFNPNLAMLTSPTNSGNAVAHLRFCLPQQQQQLSQQQQLLNRQKSIPTPGTPNTPSHQGFQQSPVAPTSAAVSGSGSGANLGFTSMIGKLPVVGPGMAQLTSPTGRPTVTLRTEASNLTELLLGDSLGNPVLMQAKQNAWSASSQQSIAPTNSLNSLNMVSPPNVNIANAGSLPPNINIQNIASLPGLGIVNLQNSPGSASGNLQSRAFVSVVTTVASASSVSAASLASPTSVLSPSSSDAISVPIGMTGSLTNFMNTSSVKTSPIIKPGAPLLLSAPVHLTGPRSQILAPGHVNQEGLIVTSKTAGSAAPFRSVNLSAQPFQQVAPPNITLQQQHVLGKSGSSQLTASVSAGKNKNKKGTNAPAPTKP